MPSNKRLWIAVTLLVTTGSWATVSAFTNPNHYNSLVGTSVPITNSLPTKWIKTTRLIQMSEVSAEGEGSEAKGIWGKVCVRSSPGRIVNGTPKECRRSFCLDWTTGTAVLFSRAICRLPWFPHLFRSKHHYPQSKNEKNFYLLDSCSFAFSSTIQSWEIPKMFSW